MSTQLYWRGTARLFETKGQGHAAYLFSCHWNNKNIVATENGVASIESSKLTTACLTSCQGIGRSSLAFSTPWPFGRATNRFDVKPFCDHIWFIWCVWWCIKVNTQSLLFIFSLICMGKVNVTDELYSAWGDWALSILVVSSLEKPLVWAVLKESQDESSEVAWHWDRDYSLERSGVNVHPMLGTVTYLSQGEDSDSAQLSNLVPAKQSSTDTPWYSDCWPVYLDRGFVLRELKLLNCKSFSLWYGAITC